MSFLFDTLTREACEGILEEDGYERGKLVGKLQGQEEERAKGIHILIEDNLENEKSPEQISSNLQKRYGLSEDECREYLKDVKEI